MKSFFFFKKKRTKQPNTTNSHPTKMSNQKAGTQNWINLVRCHDSTTIEGNPYLISQTTAIIQFKQCFSFRLRRHQIHSIFLNFSIYYFSPLFFLSIREHCHSTCLVQACIEMTREKLLPGLSPNTAVGKTQNEHFILAKSVFFSLFILLDPAAASDATGHVVQNGQGIWRSSQVLEACFYFCSPSQCFTALLHQCQFASSLSRIPNTVQNRFFS